MVADPRRAERAALRIALAGVGACAAATLAWALATLTVRPLDGVEGEVLFEADRLAAGLALYTDPALGAHDYGAVPARFYVLYPPLWSAFLSLVPRVAMVSVARGLALVAWSGTLAWAAWRAPRERAATVGIAALAVFGTWVLASYGASGRPDGPAVAMCGLALERASRRSARIDVLAGALFALGAWIKPNVVGLAAGAFVGAFLAAGGDGPSARARLRAVAPGLIGAFLVSSLAAGALTLASGRAWVEHLLASTGQPPSLSLWWEQVALRGPFFLAPLAFVMVVGLRARRDPGAMIAVSALVVSTAWCLLCLAKIGSASNYFLEPCLAAVIVLARADIPPFSPRARSALAGATLLQVTWNGVASVKSAFSHITSARAQSAALAEVRALCNSGPADVVLADEPGLERMLDGRIVATPFQSTHLARRGRFPVDRWLGDIARPEVTCLVMQNDLLEQPLTEVHVEHDRFGPELRRALGAEFVLATERADLWIYRRRPNLDPSGSP